MLLQKINIQEKLERAKQKNNDPDILLHELYGFLREVDIAEERIADNMKLPTGNVDNPFNFELLESSRIYHLSHIKQIAIDYRLRFLDVRYFKGKIPQETTFKIRKLEERHQIEIQGFKILAPSKLFKLEDRDDPILFAPIANDYFYLIHKWGNDLHPLRKILMWPFKGVINLFAVIVSLSYLITLSIPEGLFSKSSSSVQFWVLFVFMFNSMATIVIYYAVAKGKNFNPAIWNNRFLKT